MSDDKKKLKVTKPGLTPGEMKRGYKVELTISDKKETLTVGVMEKRFVFVDDEGQFAREISILDDEKVVSKLIEPRHRVVMQEYKFPDNTIRYAVNRVSGGEIIKRFDATPFPEKSSDVVCPHFLEMKWATGCPFNCAWCYLQGTLRIQGTAPTVKDMPRTLRHLRAFMGSKSGPELLNAGEISDSLLYPSEALAKKLGTPRSEPLIAPILEELQGQEHHRLLLVTKSSNVDWFLSRSFKNLIFSFSVNATEVARKWEKAPAPLDRLAAARSLADVGYRVRIRLDPIVPIAGWQQAYEDIIQEIVGKFNPERVTLGTLRALTSTVAQAKDKSWTGYCTEKTNFGKRMPIQKRIEVYEHILGTFLEHGFRGTALCKENIEVFERLDINWKALECNCLL